MEKSILNIFDPWQSFRKSNHIRDIYSQNWFLTFFENYIQILKILLLLGYFSVTVKTFYVLMIAKLCYIATSNKLQI